ncbi:MAG TPA: UDP-N-acetylglucosamine 2-epimerase (non-hydrolyzing) [Thermomicrobiales bacterium]|nr:UDP-N-acetylglucosamine 2-epimerase (non-hydrolyzing) [Thermomicrobiales bacterium]
MKVLTILGTRPEIIRLSRTIARLDQLCEHTLVHTGQNFDPALSDVFFRELGVRQPDHYLDVRGESSGARVGQILTESERLMRRVRPDRLLILGDTDSALSAFIAKRLGIPVYHMEAGNRCFDDRVPEEVNRRVIDHCSDVLLPYTERSRANLLREGIESRRVYVTGNPINEVLRAHEGDIAGSDVLARLGLEPGGYFLLTAHRQENVDVPARLRSLVEAAARVAAEYGLLVICSVHPRTRQRIAEFGVAPDDAGVRLYPPFGFFDFVQLERRARCVLTDSGTVQEECCIFRVPTVTIRDTTERPETLECGSNTLSGVDPAAVLRCVRLALADPPTWSPPPEYLAPTVSQTVASLVLGH